MRTYYADLHIHIGRTSQGRPVKISGSRNLTFAGIAKEASERKGIALVGIIDCHAPGVQRDIADCLDAGSMAELPGGGIRYADTTLLLGSEIEVRDPGTGPVHLLVFLRDLAAMRAFTDWMRPHMANVELSSQRLRLPARTLQDEVAARGGLLIPAHIFTPHRGLYGCGTDRMANLLDPSRVAAVELGLSADSTMAGLLSELDGCSFLTNSDAHSLGKIGREYNAIRMKEPSFDEFVLAIGRRDGRFIAANYGLNPRLGKYHRTYCLQCESILDERGSLTERCSYCGSTKIVRGVMDRLLQIADREVPLVPPHRPPYYYQVPLEFLPGLGSRTLERLLGRFGTEMRILHEASEAELAETAGEALAAMILQARRGELGMTAGGGGSYGKVRHPGR